MTAPHEEFHVDNPRHPERNVQHFLVENYPYDTDANGEKNPTSRWKITYHRGNYYEWKSSVWRALDKETLESLVYAMFSNAVYPDGDGVPQSFPCSPGNIDAIVKGVRFETLVDRDVNVPAWLEGNKEIEVPIEPPLPAREVIACQNTLLHATTRRVFAHTPKMFNVNAVEYSYEPDASQSKEWLRFLNEIWPDDHESITLLQEWFGYSLTTRTDLQKMLMFLGPSRSGKGTIIRVLQRLLGEHSTTSASLAILNERFGLEHIADRQLAIMQDARFRSRDDGVAVERLLSITGEDEVAIDKKGKGIYAAKLSTRFVLVSNELPVMQDESGALQRRFVILKTLDSVAPGLENSNLGEMFIPELPGILNWALDGLDRLNLRGHFVQPKSAAEDAEMLSRLSSNITSFAEEYLTSGVEETVSRNDLYTVYEAWAKQAGVRAKSRDVLGRDLRSKFPRMRSEQVRVDGKRVRQYVGVGLNHAGQEILDQFGFAVGL